jgi:subtilisin family serine protease
MFSSSDASGWNRGAVPTFLQVFAGLTVAASLSAQPVSIAIGPSGSGSKLSKTGNTAPTYHPTRVLVRFRNGARHEFLPGSGVSRGFPGDSELYLVEKPSGLSVAQAVRSYRANPNVLYAEPDYIVRAVALPTDPRWSEQWDMTKILCPAAWDTLTDAGDVVVAVIDSGIDYTHPDLQGNLWTDPADGTHGFTCMSGDCRPGGADDFGHGTHVAGTIGATANDGIGIAGINWNVQLLSLKFLDSNGFGSISDAVLCFDKVTALKQQGFNIRVTSNSWGGSGFSQALKDAMARAESGGIVHVCAAGNNGQNTDVFPMYPAAYENRGIVSVLASDSNDAGASFTNYGLFSVDIAAPGVGTLSTVPTGTCALCDASGYRRLSGTSMATPHVSGVLAALFHRNRDLTAEEARDVVLDPGSYDALTNARAASTSTGGRLNFAKTLANPLLFAPVRNNFPSLTVGADVFASAGSAVDLSATTSDPDGDPLRVSWGRTAGASSLWLVGSMLSSLFPDASGNSFSFSAPALAHAVTMPYDASVADGRGGGAHGRTYVTVAPGLAPGSPPLAGFAVTPTEAPAGSTISVTFSASDPDGGPVQSDLWVGTPGTANGWCCYGSGTTTVRLDNPGVFRFSTQAIDRQLNLSGRQSTVVRIGGATGEPPIGAVAQDRSTGPVPLTVNLDMSASSDVDGSIARYSFFCGEGNLTPGAQPSKASCTYDEPGTYWIHLQVWDDAGNVDTIPAYAYAISVSEGGGPDPAVPTVSITSPVSGAHVSGAVAVSASASSGSPVSNVSFFLDSGTPLGSASSPPWAISWDSSGVSPGPHAIYATARDSAGNVGTSATVPIIVDPITPPQVSITSPINGSTVARRSTVVIQASVIAGSDAVSRVDFLVDSAVVCSDATAPYGCNWAVPSKPNRSYQLRANGYDTKGRMGTSSIVTVTAR